MLNQFAYPIAVALLTSFVSGELLATAARAQGDRPLPQLIRPSERQNPNPPAAPPESYGRQPSGHHHHHKRGNVTNNYYGWWSIDPFFGPQVDFGYPIYPVVPGWNYPAFGFANPYPFTGVYGSPYLYPTNPFGYSPYPPPIFPNQSIGPLAPILPQRPAVNIPPQPQRGVPFAPAVDQDADKADRELVEILRRVDVLKPSTTGGRDRADRLISQADAYFADQRYAAASGKYREAMAKAPDYAPTYFRLAHCHVASGDFNLALTRFLMGLELAGSADRGNFSLNELYRGNKLAKKSHIDRLQDAILREPNDGGLVFLLAVFLFYDEQPFEARELFARAANMPGVHQNYVRHFVPIAAIAEPDE